MKYKVIVLIISFFSLCLAACQSETETPATIAVEAGGNSPSSQTGETQLPTSTPGVSEEIINETQQTFAATATPEPTPIPAAGGNHTSGSGGGETSTGNDGGSNGGQSFTNVGINSGTFDGAILETQFVTGGGNADWACIASQGTIPIDTMDVGGLSVDEMTTLGCVLLDGFPAYAVDLYGQAGFSTATTFAESPNTWSDNFTRYFFQGFDPNENMKMLFYEMDNEVIKGTLVGWQDIQVDSDGFFLLKTALPFSLDGIRVVVQRSNGEMICDCGVGVSPFTGSDGDGGEPSADNDGGSNGTQSTNVSINSGAYEGAILETQIVGGGGGDIGPSCVGEGGIINLPGASPDNMTTDELIAAGCVLIDGSPFTICCLRPDSSSAQRPWPHSSGANLWNDNLTRIVIHDLDPFENVKILFYEGKKDLGLPVSSLLGWQEVQVDSNGFLLLKTDLPFPFDNYFYPGSNFDLVLQRENGVMSRDFGDYLDSDGDDLDDYSEVYVYNTDLRNMDSDGDGLGDGEEARTYFTDPQNWDTDGDGRSDGDEVFTYDSDPNNPDDEESTLDSDGDGLSDEEEASVYFTDPDNPDSDGDARSDGDEVVFGTDPTTIMNADDVSAVGLVDGAQFYRDFNSELAWIETNSFGDFFFQELQRGPWGIFLYDASRDMNVHLDFWTKEMFCNDSFCGTIEWVGR